MKIHKTKIEGLLILEPNIFKDERGYFFESYHAAKYHELGVECSFVQDNQSLSSAGTLRGLHFQKPPFDQAKLVRVVRGSVYDVAIDLRRGSPTYGQYEGVILDGEKNNQFFIPSGFAHGFLALEDNTLFTYKCSNYYHKASEGGIIWNDPSLNINWNYLNPMVSEKDILLPKLESFESPFIL